VFFPFLQLKKLPPPYPTDYVQLPKIRQTFRTQRNTNPTPQNQDDELLALLHIEEKNALQLLSSENKFTFEKKNAAIFCSRKSV
jgi:hypothetical protein